MKEIDSIAETDHIVETEYTEIDYIVEKDHETTIRMTIEGTIERIIEMKIIETRDIRKT